MPLSPWSPISETNIQFPLRDYEKLLTELGWPYPSDWLNFWLEHCGTELASTFWPSNTKFDWIWGIGLPLLSDVKRFLTQDSSNIIGITGLPGCGKTSLGRWIEASALELNWPVSVISLDDFYLPASELQKAMLSNPWNVPRGIPGSHSLLLMEESIDRWINNGYLFSPKFDKSLRNGLGDRCGWKYSEPKVLVIEGWFLGCRPDKSDLDYTTLDRRLSPALTEDERNYRLLIQDRLHNYLPIWNRIDRIWHLKAIDSAATSSWKEQQENQMKVERGAALQGKALESFIRMIQVVMPQKIMNSIKADVVAKININREVIWVGSRENDQI